VTPETIPHHIQLRAAERPTAPAYCVRQDSGWEATDWATYAGQVSQAARSMIALGLPAGGTVGILGYNRPEWVIFDTAAMTAGAIPAGIYATSSDEECAYILNHCRAHLLLVEDEEQLGKIQPQLDQLPHLRYVITMRGVGRTDHPAVLTWEEFTASGEVVSESELEARLKALKPDDPATLIYTSGTTGLPKGVTLSHDNLARQPGVDRDAGRGAAGSEARREGAVVPAAIAHRGADVLHSHRVRAGVGYLLCPIVGAVRRQPRGGASHLLLRRPARLGEVPRRRRG
jgi:long-subunit acyl-CoA synthetase (AMP-forming)